VRSATACVADLGATPIVECVPNVSEGRDSATLEACHAAIAGVPDVRILHVDRGADANRTVFTFAGPPEAVGDAAIRLAHAVARTVDMRRHRGAHPRLGALDVCPFVPVRGVTLERCAVLARRVGSAIAHDLDIPVYLYEAAAFRDDRRNLAAIRAGGYEGLADRIGTTPWIPDFGPARVSPTMGAAIVGARTFLIAWNVSLATTDVQVARRIAARVRASGEGGVRADRRGGTPGRLAAVRAIGWSMPAYGCVQVSMNVLDAQVTPLHVAFRVVQEEAAREGVAVLGSELVGLVPAAALVAAGRALGGGDNEEAAMRAAVAGLGLDCHGPFALDERVLERVLARAMRDGHATIGA
jgi:glutamate formiminotransferase/formiminotetrahydrofolate cyclodeaminase